MRDKLILTLGIVAAVLVVLVLLDTAIDRPLRGYLERTVNSKLQGYTAKIGAVDFQLWNLALEFNRVTLFQQAHPEPPMADFPRINFNVQWSALIHGRVVADLEITRPVLHVNLTQLSEEQKDDVDIEERGWQQAIEAVYPLKINELTITDGRLTYIDEDPEKPINVSQIYMVAKDIRNVRSRAGAYPSPLHLEARLFDQGRVVADGHADFLAEPTAAFKVVGEVRDVPLDKLEPVTIDYNIAMKGGIFSGRGMLEYSPKVKIAEVPEAEIRNLRVDYISSPAGQAAEQELAQEAKKANQEVANEPGILIKVDQLRIVDSEFGFVNKAADPNYRVFLSDADVVLNNVTNQLREGESKFAITGAFMGSGRAEVRGTMRPEKNGPDLSVRVALQGTDMRRLNDVFRAYSGMDVAAGQFSFFSELAVRDGRIDGYIKPLFKDVDVYNPAQDRHKSFFKRVYEGIVEGLAKLLDNPPREEVATVARVSGSVADPHASTFQVIVGLIQNAFFDAILPGFERQAGTVLKAGGGKRDRDRDEDRKERTGAAR
ncbi:MAG: DUF748 domain-containing protein [Acidobacteria bacterium]|nr:DUF748 domain-containing protein [Acidobacteriota bacterium]